MERWGKLAWIVSLSSVLSLGSGIFPTAARADHCLFLVDDTYFIIWTLDAETGEPIRAFSAPAAAMGNNIPAGRSGLAFDGANLFYTHSSVGRIFVLDPFSGGVIR